MVFIFRMQYVLHFFFLIIIIKTIHGEEKKPYYKKI